MTPQVQRFAPGPSAVPHSHAAAEQIFAEALRDFIAELCLLDGGVLIGWIRGERHGNIADIVSSSAELFFKESVLTYADAAELLERLDGEGVAGLCVVTDDVGSRVKSLV